MSDTATADLWSCVLCGAMAGGLAWGIRGQYGHETGAMLAGLMIGFVLSLLLSPAAGQLRTARAIAWACCGIGIGGSMTYGQTIGLTQNAPLIGNWDALRWGMLGLAVKGGIWIGLGGVFLGMGWGTIRYRPLELLLVMLGLVGLAWFGIKWLNEPFHPREQILPPIYFSASWFWQPDAGPELKPRAEVWGGLLMALVGLFAYVRGVRGDRLAFRLGLWGVLGGAVGFPLGQSLQAFHAWNPQFFASGWLAEMDRVTNWWNFMETAFGATLGACLGAGAWLNRRMIGSNEQTAEVSIPPTLEWLLIGLHTFLLLCEEFNILASWSTPATEQVIRIVSNLYDPGLLLVFVPVVAICGGRIWPYAMVFPLVLIPIMGKTFRNLCLENQTVSLGLGGTLYLLLPLSVLLAAAVTWSRKQSQNEVSRPFLEVGLLVAIWVPFLLNFAFFEYPWPWQLWTRRTPNAVVFTLCALGLTTLAVRSIWLRRSHPANSAEHHIVNAT